MVVQIYFLLVIYIQKDRTADCRGVFRVSAVLELATKLSVQWRSPLQLGHERRFQWENGIPVSYVFSTLSLQKCLDSETTY